MNLAVPPESGPEPDGEATQESGAADSPAGTSLAKSFSPGEIEKRWYPFWETQGYFDAGVKPGRPSFGIQLPPPNVTGILHMGHAFNQTIMDALTRVHRMRGFNTLWVPGIDHAGIATQIVVERQIEQQGLQRRTLGREAFVEKVWQWKQYSGDTILQQMRRLGDSCDWKRAYFTMDEARSEAVVDAFVRLYEQGLIYRGKRLVNWDPVLQTAVSDLEVESEEEDGRIWEIRYPALDGGPGLVVATTRPETMLGDVAVAVHPEDPRYLASIGTQLQLPLTGRSIPVVADSFVDASFGTGCVKITPAHDFNDFAVAQRHGLAPIAILTLTATINENAPERFRGMDRYVARKAVLEELRVAGLLVSEKPHRMMIPRCARTGEVVEPMLSDQWYVAMSAPAARTPEGNPGPSLAQVGLDAVDSGAVRIVPDQWRLVYRQWLTNIQDWCISRQLWWGHRIPAWYDSKGGVHVARTEEQARAQAIAAGAGSELRREEDVLDTWFSSALVPFSTLNVPGSREPDPAIVARYLPSSVLVTGHEILFFWVARMVVLTAHFTGRVPFRDVYIHGIVRDAEGKKMSKSEGNTIDPVDLLDGIELEALVRKNTTGLRKPEDAPKVAARLRKEFPNGMPAYGADALRFTMAAYATLGRDINFDFKRCEGYRNFANKLWNATRFVLMNTEGRDCGAGAPESACEFSPVDRWITGELQRTAAEVAKGFEDYRLDNVAQAVYRFAWEEYCDWYVELAKVQLARGSEAQQRATRRTLVQVLSALLRLTHPIAPFITEELWQKVSVLAGERGAQEQASIMVQPYPHAQMNRVDESSDAWMQVMRQIVDAARNVRSEMKIAPSRKVPMRITPRDPRLEEFAPYLMALARLESVEAVDELDAGDVAVPVAVAGKFRFQLVIPVDVAAERERLAKELARLDGEIARAQAQLTKPSFVDKAPAPVVANLRKRLADFSEQRVKVAEDLQRLEGR
jgi:valyl-tRNA synthetase